MCENATIYSAPQSKTVDWSQRTVSDKLRVDRFRIADIALYYFEGKLYVNRKYQRKLVWSVKEKQLLIDSILAKIPLPTILLAEFEVNNEEYFEIIDGVQRLNAIISFMLGDFSIPYNGQQVYFDLSSTQATFHLIRDGIVEQKTPVLPVDVCYKFSRFEIPVTMTGQDDAMIEMIFDRINSTGRKLSSHDLRQSRSVGEFPDLVRRIACRVRGEHTCCDRINLCDMPKISVGNREDGYGIDLNDSFWRRHDIITESNLKESKDEEIIEAILGTILLGNKFRKSRSVLDDLYSSETKLGQCVAESVQRLGKDALEDITVSVFDIIDSAFRSIGSNFSDALFDRKRAAGKDECFKVLFLAIFNLVVSDYVVSDYNVLGSAITTTRNELSSIVYGTQVNYSKVSTAVANVRQLIQPAFSKKVQRVSTPEEQELDFRFSLSSVETQLMDYKIGISDFDSDKVNYNCIHKIGKTLVAMSNTAKAGDVGYVVIGVPDCLQSYNDWFRCYKGDSVTINQHIIVGVEKEALKLFGSVDKYIIGLRKLLQNEPISSELKGYVLKNFHALTYHGKEIILLPSKKCAAESLYNGQSYVRKGNETITADSSDRRMNLF